MERFISVKSVSQPFYVVPPVPTPEMIRAGADALTIIVCDTTTEMVTVWQAMLAAWEASQHEDMPQDELGEDYTVQIPHTGVFAVPYEPTAEQVAAGIDCYPIEEASAKDLTPENHRMRLVSSYKTMILAGA